MHPHLMNILARKISLLDQSARIGRFDVGCPATHSDAATLPDSATGYRCWFTNNKDICSNLVTYWLVAQILQHFTSGDCYKEELKYHIITDMLYVCLKYSDTVRWAPDVYKYCSISRQRFVAVVEMTSTSARDCAGVPVEARKSQQVPIVFKHINDVKWWQDVGMTGRPG